MFAHQRIAEDPQQLAAQRQPPARFGQLLAHHRPDLVEGKPVVAGESHDLAVGEMRRQRIPGDRRPHDLAGESERGPDHGEPVLLFDDDRCARIRLAQALVHASDEHPRTTTPREEVEQHRAIHGSRHWTPIDVVDLDGQMVEHRPLLEGRSAAIELEDAHVKLGHGRLPRIPEGGWRSGDRATRPKYSQNASRRVAPGGIFPRQHAHALAVHDLALVGRPVDRVGAHLGDRQRRAGTCRRARSSSSA